LTSVLFERIGTQKDKPKGKNEKREK